LRGRRRGSACPRSVAPRRWPSRGRGRPGYTRTAPPGRGGTGGGRTGREGVPTGRVLPGQRAVPRVLPEREVVGSPPGVPLLRREGRPGRLAGDGAWAVGAGGGGIRRGGGSNPKGPGRQGGHGGVGGPRPAPPQPPRPPGPFLGFGGYRAGAPPASTPR